MNKDIKRFESKYLVIPETGCWQWIGSLNEKGYGRFSIVKNGKPYSVRAHRWHWEQLYGVIPVNFQLDHLCRNRACVNPMHLEVVTLKENILRGNAPSAKNARKKFCNRGHELKDGNIRKDNGGRRCLLCKRIIDAKYRNLKRSR